MARPLRIQFSGACYHVIARGQQRGNIFLDDIDRFRFLDTLTDALEYYEALLHAYCLMNNHYHLVIRTLHPNLSRLMHALNTTYAGWWNNRHEQCGHVLGGRYKAPLVQEEGYLVAVTGYVHLNPVRTDAWKKRPARERYKQATEFAWSSLREYTRSNQPRRNPSVYQDTVWGELGAKRPTDGRMHYRKYIQSWLKEEELRYKTGDNPEEDAQFNPLINLKRSAFLGDDKFGDKLETLLGSDRQLSTEVAGHQEWHRPCVNLIGNETANRLNIDKEDLTKRQRGKKNKTMAIALVKRISRASNRDVGQWFQLSVSAISKALTRDAQWREEDSSYKQKMRELEKSLTHYFKT